MLSLAAGVLAVLDGAGGDLQPALTRLETTASGSVRTDPWLGRCLSVEAARLSIANGQVERALYTLEPLPHRDDHEVAVVLAAAYAEQGDYAAVQECLSGVRAGAAPLGARVAELFVEGVCESRQSPPVRSRDLLSRSLRLAAPEGLRRPFREAGPAARRVLTADPRLLLENGWLDSSSDRTAPSREPELVEQLTARELEVLRHLEELLTTEEIAEKMFVSVNTVRTHVRSILRKLGVSRRNAAVRKARQLGLVGR
jgi:LuxR family maltose regulon positive regulatory protein